MRDSSKSWFENWIFHSFKVTKEGLGLYRIFTALFLLFFMLPPRGLYAFLAHLPADFYTPPPGPMALFQGFPPEYFFLILHCLLILSLISLCLGFFSKISSIVTGMILLILKGFIFSIGKINHEMLLVLVPLVMAFSGWGGAYSIDAKRRKKLKIPPQSWPLTLLALIIGFMFFTAGLPKILGGWLDIHTQAVYGHYLKEFVVHKRVGFGASVGQQLGDIIWEIMDYTTVLFEVSFLIAVSHPKSTRIFVSLAVLFHFGTMVLLNITFLPNFLAYAAFLNWSKISKMINAKVTDAPIKWGAPTVIGLGLTMLFATAGLFDWLNLLQLDWGAAGVLVVSFSALIAASYLGKTTYLVLKKSKL